MRVHSNSSERSVARGFTILETIVSLLVSSIILLVLMGEYSTSLRFAHDEEVKVTSMVRAQAVLEAIGAELRVLGNGVPYDQSNFQIGESTLTDTSKTEPIDVATSNASSISFRLNETGEVYLVTVDFDPSSTLTMSLTDTTGIESGDELYLSNSVVGGDDGLYGVVASVDHGAQTVTLAAGPVASPGAVFNMGTICERVPVITYTSAADGSGITRNSGLGNVVMAKNSTFTIDYIKFDGTTLSLPLTQTNLVDDLRRIKVTVNVTSDRLLRDGTTYVATVSQTYSLRNLNYLF